MSTSVVPKIVDALVAQADAALASVNVFDGFGTSGEPGDFLMVGVDDPDGLGSTFSADASQSAATMGNPRRRDESGAVTCVALSWNGNTDQKAARDAAFATVAAVETFLRLDPSLGVTAAGLVVVEMGDNLRLMQNQDESGAEAAVIFEVRFRARL